MRLPRRQYRAYVSGTLYTLGVLLIGIPLALMQLGFYWLRRAAFGTPFGGDWSMEDVRNRLHSRDS